MLPEFVSLHYHFVSLHYHWELGEDTPDGSYPGVEFANLLGSGANELSNLVRKFLVW